MDNSKLTPRALRLKEIYEESTHRSVASFARSIGINQPTMANFMSGLRDPSDRSLDAVLVAYPQYNRKWLLDGIGEKYNPDYVETKDVSQPEPHDDGFVAKMSQIYDKLISYMEKCQSLEEQLRQANAMIEELKRGSHEEE